MRLTTNFTILRFYDFTILRFYDFTILRFYDFTILRFYDFTILRNDNKEIKSLLTSYGFTQLIKEPTRIDGDTQSLIDIILTNNVSNIRQTAVIPTSIGDHDKISCVRKINYVKFPSKKIIARNYRNYDTEKLNEHLLSRNWDELYELNDVNLSWNFIKNILSNAFDMFAPQKNSETSPW